MRASAALNAAGVIDSDMLSAQRGPLICVIRYDRSDSSMKYGRMPYVLRYAFARSALRETMSNADVEKPRGSIDPVSSMKPKTDSRYAASAPLGWKRTSARATAGISLGSLARQRNSSKKRSAPVRSSPKVVRARRLSAE